ncbi:hypothetical protein JW826_05320 [Candidatus Woesearchaeota archaeon]|nr:hypothetical protein [Candidatus Woesearchaeota archaeon]
MKQEISKTPRVKEVVDAVFPEYKGRGFSVSTDLPKEIDASRSTHPMFWYWFYYLASGHVTPVPGNLLANQQMVTSHVPWTIDSLFEHLHIYTVQERGPNELFDGLLLAEYARFAGQNAGFTIYGTEKDITDIIAGKPNEYGRLSKRVIPPSQRGRG